VVAATVPCRTATSVSRIFTSGNLAVSFHPGFRQHTPVCPIEPSYLSVESAIDGSIHHVHSGAGQFLEPPTHHQSVERWRAFAILVLLVVTYCVVSDLHLGIVRRLCSAAIVPTVCSQPQNVFVSCAAAVNAASGHDVHHQNMCNHLSVVLGCAHSFTYRSLSRPSNTRCVE